jgi:hypothetical protein
MFENEGEMHGGGMDPFDGGEVVGVPTGDGDSCATGCELTGVTFTRATPFLVIPIFSAARFERSRLGRERRDLDH